MIILITLLGIFSILFVFLYIFQIRKTKKLEQKLITEHHSKIFHFEEFNKKLQDEIQQRTLHLENTADELKNSNKDLDTFIYKTSHDIKSPLSSLEGLCQIMLLESDIEVIKDFIKKQQHTIATMQLLLFRVVEIGNIRHHKVVVEKLKLHSYFRTAIRGMVKQKNYDIIDFQVDIDSELKISTDIEMLDLIIMNLIKNAIENVEIDRKDKQPIIRIEVEEKYNNHIKITISDNGRGVPKDILDSLFDMFVKGHIEEKNFGLGLYKAKIAAKKINGNLEFVKNVHKTETIFVLTLPKNIESQLENTHQLF